MTREIKTLFDAGCVAEEAHVTLNQAMSAFSITLDRLDDEAPKQSGTCFDSVFTDRYPMYSDTLHLIFYSMWEALNELQAGADAIFAASGRRPPGRSRHEIPQGRKEIAHDQ